MILKFLQFIKEELTNLRYDSSNSGNTRSIHKIYDDEDPDPKSLASGLLLRNKLKQEEIESISNMLGGEIPKHFLENRRIMKLLVVFNNLKFLKDMLVKKGELRCEYCDKSPLVIYDISKNSDNIHKFLKNPWHRMSDKFDPVDGATCDHKNPQSKGGNKFDYDNLAICCSSCNQKKADMSYEEWMKYLEVSKS